MLLPVVPTAWRPHLLCIDYQVLFFLAMAHTHDYIICQTTRLGVFQSSLSRQIASSSSSVDPYRQAFGLLLRYFQSTRWYNQHPMERNILVMIIIRDIFDTYRSGVSEQLEATRCSCYCSKTMLQRGGEGHATFGKQQRP